MKRQSKSYPWLGLAAALLLLGCPQADEPATGATDDTEAPDTTQPSDGEAPTDAVEPDAASEEPDSVAVGCETDGECKDEDACTEDTCDVATGLCKNLPIPGCAACAVEGESFKGNGACCDGLVAVPDCTVDSAGQCSCPKCLCFMCTNCGDDTCGAGENHCNCPKDCKESPPIPCNGPLEPCPDGMFCKNPPDTCDTLGVSGICAPIPEGCDDIYDPVCGCDGKTYANACELDTAQVSKGQDGECAGGCLGPGEEFTDFDTEGKCCPGLAPIPACVGDGADCACPNCPCYICSSCGDDVCEDWENPCSCPADCEGTGPNPCVDAGGSCVTPPPGDSKACPPDTSAVFLAGCPESQVCCMPDEAKCVVAGDTVGVFPGAPECCAGLESIMIAEYDPVTGSCEGLLGAALCSDCGNGICEAWENPCNCDGDCESGPKQCYGPLMACGESEYCKNPESTCDVPGYTGTCVAIPEACIDVENPVCGCDEKTYSNECYLEEAQMSKAYDGECGDCLGLGGEFTDFESEGKCCPGLVPVPDCTVAADGGCSCPKCPCFVCALCGDGFCDKTNENKCSCPEDCKEKTACEAAGGTCGPIPPPEGPPCPPGLVPAMAPCGPDEMCCVPKPGDG